MIGSIIMIENGIFLSYNTSVNINIIKNLQAKYATNKQYEILIFYSSATHLFTFGKNKLLTVTISTEGKTRH